MFVCLFVVFILARRISFYWRWLCLYLHKMTNCLLSCSILSQPTKSTKIKGESLREMKGFNFQFDLMMILFYDSVPFLLAVSILQGVKS